MKDLRKRFDRFCFRNRDKGIPNLMLYIAIGNAIVLILSLINGGSVLYELLCFDKDKILQGQVWRLVTYVFTQSGGGYLELLFLYFFYMLGRQVEYSMGTFKFNLFYLSGVLLMDIFAMIFCPLYPDQLVTPGEYAFYSAVLPMYWSMAYYLHLTLVLTFATTHPDAHFVIFFIIPIKAWVIAVVSLVLEFVAVFNLSYPVMYFPHNLFPLVALANYFLFMGKDVLNLVPFGLRAWFSKVFRKKSKQQPKVIHFSNAQANEASAAKTPYTHRCTVCGRTDISDPDLEFRYCSRCKGYHCYCEDHINDHTHVE